MTIFYSGKVNVYDDISGDKVMGHHKFFFFFFWIFEFFFLFFFKKSWLYSGILIEQSVSFPGKNNNAACCKPTLFASCSSSRCNYSAMALSVPLTGCRSQIGSSFSNCHLPKAANRYISFMIIDRLLWTCLFAFLQRLL